MVHRHDGRADRRSHGGLEHRDLDDGGHTSKDQIPLQVSELVVDALEVVDVQQQKAKGLQRSAGRIGPRSQVAVQALPVENAGQAVKLGLRLAFCHPNGA